MKPLVRLFAVLLTFAAATLSFPAYATDITEITPDDFYGATYFKNALEHPKVQKQKSERRRIQLVARDMGWKRKKLANALEKVRGLDGEPIELATAALREAFETSRVKGRVLKVVFDDRKPDHVVCFIRWRGTHLRDAAKDASTIAHLVSMKAPFASTLSLAAIHPKSTKDTKANVWEGVISRSAMLRISPRRIDMLADSRYKDMFEEHTERPF